MQKAITTINNAIKAMGLVFGDIGTSPIYTLSVIFLTTKVTHQNVVGILSLILWTLILVVTLQYTYFAMSLSRRGEGGAIVLNEITKKLLGSSRATVFFSYLTYVGVSLLIGDSVITPAISILSAVEGLELVPKLAHITQSEILVITLIITILLFSFQKKGIEKVAQVFGPIMLAWFLLLGISGILMLSQAPNPVQFIFESFNPVYGLEFLLHNSFAGFFILSQIILCATGAEALYADMGHLGRKPIVHAWYFVFVALVLNYLGQGAFLIQHAGVKNIIFTMLFSLAPVLYIPFLALSILATIIASQAMISGLFSVIYQAINVRVLPLLKISFTSEKLKTQIYIDSVNWFLMVCVILTILVFKKSSALAGIYGFSVAGAITITAVMISVIFFLRRQYGHLVAALMLVVVDMCFFVACFSKIHQGGYWSLCLAAIPLTFIILYIHGSRVLYAKMSPMGKETFLKKYRKIYETPNKIQGTALFFAKGIQKVPPYVANTMFVNNIIYTDNVFVSINQTNDPHGIEWKVEDIEKGLRMFKISAGYMEVLDIIGILKSAGIGEKAVFYGVEDIESRNPFWILFAKIKKLTPTFMQFYKLPPHKIHGVVTKVIMD